ncbi:MAG: hypothetical protein IIV77_09065 [Bacteroidaceae bacterium]|nr:hypothetical protein [Bacteroidaceae bacterium]
MTPMGICFCFAMQAQLQRPTPVGHVARERPDATHRRMVRSLRHHRIRPMYLPKEKRVNIW